VKAGEGRRRQWREDRRYLNVAGRLAASASGLYAKNLYNFLDILVDKKAKALAVNWDDDYRQGDRADARWRRGASRASSQDRKRG